MITFNQLIFLFGGSTAILSAVVYFLSNRIADRLNIKWKEAADINISRIQGDIDKNNNTLGGLLSLYGASHHQAQERRIKAVEILWVNLIKYKDIIPGPIHFIYNACDKNEIEGYWERKTDNKFHNADIYRLENLDFNKHMVMYMGYIENVTLERPFIGERIWFYFEIYKIFLGRIAAIIHQGVEKRKFVHWQDDFALKDMFKKTLAEKEYEYIYSMKYQTLMSTSTLLENKLLQEIDKNLSGERFSESALDRVRKFDTILGAKPKG